jgi:cytochrome c peroxidase
MASAPRSSLALALAGAVLLAGGGAAAGCGGDDAPDASADTDGGRDTSAAELCVDGRPVDWPPGPYEIGLLGTLPKGVSFEGPDGPVSLDDHFEPCALRSRLLVVRTGAAFCGTCAWHVEHTSRMLDDGRFADRLILVDLLVSDEDNMPATVAAAARWRDRIHSGGAVGIDPAYTFARVPVSPSPLPAYVFVDTRTMKIVTVATDPDPVSLHGKIAVQLALLDGEPRPEVPVAELVDGLFTENQWDLIREMRLVAEPPPDPTNEYGDDAAAAALGKTLFNDAALSPSGKVSCETCHTAEHGLSDGAAQSLGVSRVDRNSPSVALAAHARWQFWDGRADTLWMQALGPFEDEKEIDSSRLYVAHQIADRYASEYAAVFGAKYPLPDLAGLPAAGKPGDAAFDGLPEATREAVTRVFVNVGKAIAAFERSLRVRPSALDRYAAGDRNALDDAQKTGLHTFFRIGCAMCHFGPRLTNDAFHNVRFETGRQDRKPDRGRIDVLAGLADGEFVATSRWSDAPSAAKPLRFSPVPSMLGAFKTPTLRGLPETAPYGHGGTLATLRDVVRHYGQRGLDAESPLAAGPVEEWLGEFDHGAQADLLPFLEILTAEVEGL